MRRPMAVWMLAALMLAPWGIRLGAGPIYSRGGMVVSPEPHATEVGVQILEAGGNAFDAAAAVAFALAVTSPSAGNIGGGGFLVGLKAGGETVALDFREVAPGAATPEMFLDAEGRMAEGLSTKSHLAVGVPGSVDGLLRVLEEHGTLEREAILAPAIRLARDGFRMSYPLVRSLARSRALRRSEASKNVFFPGNEPPEFGGLLVQADLAKTLERVALKGREGFYDGPVADLIVAEMKRHGGLITHEDLRNYRSKFRETLTFNHGAYEFITHPPPSSGGVTIAQILGLVSVDQLRQAGYHSAWQIHLLTEAERLAFVDRNYWLGDPDFSSVPVEKLTSREYLDERRALLAFGRAGQSEGVAHGLQESEETLHYCVADGRGNVVAVTTTLNSGYGMGAVVEGAGFLLNNQMDNFSAKPGLPNQYGMVGAEANAIEPAKRMLSSMTPTIVRKEGEFFMTMGSPGGPTIITTVLQIYLNVTVFGMNISEAIDEPRFHHQWLPDVISHEGRAISADTSAALQEMGYALRERRSIGNAAGIVRLEDGVLAGHADRRGYGLAAGARVAPPEMGEKGRAEGNATNGTNRHE